jgi:hypothetical protein
MDTLHPNPYGASDVRGILAMYRATPEVQMNTQHSPGQAEDQTTSTSAAPPSPPVVAGDQPASEVGLEPPVGGTPSSAELDVSGPSPAVKGTADGHQRETNSDSGANGRPDPRSWPRELHERWGAPENLLGVRILHDFDWDAPRKGLGGGVLQQKSQFKNHKAVKQIIERETIPGFATVLVLTDDSAVDHPYPVRDVENSILYWVLNIDVVVAAKVTTADALGGVMAPDLSMFKAWEDAKTLANEGYSIDDLKKYASRSPAILLDILKLLSEVAKDDVDALSVLDASKLSSGLESVAAIFKRIAGVQRLAEVKLPAELLAAVVNRREAAEAAFKSHPDLCAELVRHKFTKSDLQAVGYRKEQLIRFESMLTDDTYFEGERKTREDAGKASGTEETWQAFFEENPWIFGYGLQFVALGKVFPTLEAILNGGSADEAGKRPDGILKTLGECQSLCLVEIKTHREREGRLLTTSTSKIGGQEKPLEYRAEVFVPAQRLMEAVAQVQSTVEACVIKYAKDGLRMKGEDGAPTGEVIFSYRPRSVLVIGCLDEFKNEKGHIKQPMFRSFELFRRSLEYPEIITFDELLHRAKFIVARSDVMADSGEE